MRKPDAISAISSLSLSLSPCLFARAQPFFFFFFGYVIACYLIRICPSIGFV